VSIGKPWDARLAAWLVAPLRDSAVTPNHLTTLRLATGVLGVYLLARGDTPNAGAWLIVLSNFLDHTDGELARMSGKGSRFGHIYDLAADAVITIGLFLGVGLALRPGPLGNYAALMGAVAGVAVAAIFHMRSDMENRLGKSATHQPRLGGFEAEDILYLLPVVTHARIMEAFLYAAALGAPIAAIIMVVTYLRSLGSQSQ
jgi:phosphatidylglycerophosphate synthase